MVPLTALWAPILLAAVLVFVASSILHMVLPFHRNDFKTLPGEDDVMEALRRFKIPPGDYLMPCAGTPDAMRRPEFVEKMKRGPVALMTVMESGAPSMGRSLASWFVLTVVVGLFAAYVAGRTLPPGTDYLQVFRVTGTVAFVGYALSQWQNTIWYKRSAITTLKVTLDGFVYGLLTGGVFGWLWPR